MSPVGAAAVGSLRRLPLIKEFETPDLEIPGHVDSIGTGLHPPDGGAAVKVA